MHHPSFVAENVFFSANPPSYSLITINVITKGRRCASNQGHFEFNYNIHVHVLAVQKMNMKYMLLQLKKEKAKL